jgi:hypothetical protein
MYRVTSENPTRHKWVAVAQASSTKLHRMAADFLFTAIGVLSLYMGRDKHSKFLRHLGVLEVALSRPAVRPPAASIHPIDAMGLLGRCEPAVKASNIGPPK